ncbi:MAG: hypothetical protein IMY67_01790 [Bacteroidetes bacterium]|nr:hypothetical protein [Bacteroidota bacterium]
MENKEQQEKCIKVILEQSIEISGLYARIDTLKELIDYKDKEINKLKIFDLISMISEAGFVNGVLSTPEKFINAIGNSESLDSLREELAESMSKIMKLLIDGNEDNQH